jgi:hypothetical protein
VFDLLALRSSIWDFGVLLTFVFLFWEFRLGALSLSGCRIPRRGLRGHCVVAAQKAGSRDPNIARRGLGGDLR